MGLSSNDSGSASSKDIAEGSSSPHQSFGNALMGLIQQKYPIAGAVGNAVGIHGAAPAVVSQAGGSVPDQPALPTFAPTTQQAPIDPQMLQAGQIGSQHSKLFEMVKAMMGAGG